jgi:hypothetical protein
MYIIYNSKKYYPSGNGYYKHKGHYLHRVKMEDKIGRRLRPDEVVHHIDGNRENNALENLEIISDLAHRKYHGRQKKRRLTPEEIEAIKILHRLGWTIAKIREQLKRSNGVVSDYVHGNKRKHIRKRFTLQMEFGF